MDPKTGNKFPFQYLTEGSSFNFMNWLLGFESLLVIEAVSYWVLYALKNEDLKKKVAKNDHRINDLLWHLEAKFFVWGYKYDYSVATKYDSSRIIKSKTLTSQITSSLDDEESGKWDSNEILDSENLVKLSTDKMLITEQMKDSNLDRAK